MRWRLELILKHIPTLMSFIGLPLNLNHPGIFSLRISRRVHRWDQTEEVITLVERSLGYVRAWTLTYRSRHVPNFTLSDSDILRENSDGIDLI